MTRNAKPIELHELEGNPNRLTKEDINNRKKSQIKLGGKVFETPEYIKKNNKAHEKWLEVVQAYIDAEVDFATNTDSGIIARYCMAHSEYLELVENQIKLKEELNNSELSFEDRIIKLNKLNLDHQINKKSELILKLESQLFLTPLSKVKNIPVIKPDSEQTDMLKKLGFENT